ARLGGTNRNAFCMRAGPAIYSGGLGAVVERRASAMGVDVTDFVRRKFRTSTSRIHRSERRIAVRMRLGQMMGVCGCAGTENFTRYLGVTLSGGIESSHRKKGRAFTKSKTVTMRVERAALRG